MKVLQVINALCAGGAETFAVELATTLTEFCEVEFLTYAGKLDEKGVRLEQHLNENDVPYRDANAKTPLQRIQVPLWLSRQIQRCKPDIVHVHLPRVEQFAILATLLGARGPVYLRTKHDSLPIPESAYSTFIRDFFSAHIACSPAALAPLKTAGFSRHALLPNGLTPRAIPDREHIGMQQRASLGIPTQAKVAISIGRIECNDGAFLKAQDLIVRALQQATDMSNLHVVFVGGGKAIDELKQLAACDPTSGRIHFTGVVADIAPWVAAADFMLMASPREGLPMTAIECACFDLPLLLSEIDAFELFRCSSTRYFQAGNSAALINALRNMIAELNFLTIEAKSNGAAYRDRFSMRNVAQQHMQLYRQVLAGKVST